jgi:elongation factor G
MAGPILLEPVMKVEVTTPAEYQGEIVGDISRRRGTIQSIDTKSGQVIVNAHVPLAEMFGYATAIRSLSKGRASYSMEPFSFEQVPNSVLDRILDTAKNKPAART